METIGYWRRARSWAFANTKTYTLPKAVPPILAAFIQYWFFRMRLMSEMFIIVGTVVGGYVLLYCLEFSWKLLFSAPSAIDAEMQSRHADLLSNIEGLKSTLSRKHPHDEHKEAQVKTVLSCLSEVERRAIIWLLDAGKVSRGRLQQMGFNADLMMNNRECSVLLAYDSHCPGNGTVELDRFYYINPNMTDAVRNVIHPSTLIVH